MNIPHSSEVVIVGGGVIGTSIACQLSKQGMRDIVLFEKNLLGFAETSNCVGGIRQQFSTSVNIELSRESVRIFENFKEETDREVAFNQYGYLFLAANPSEFEQLKRNVALQNSLRVNSRVVSVEEVAKIEKEINLDDIVGGTFCHEDGFSDPHEVTQAFASFAREKGARLLEKTEVVGISVEKEGRFKVRTPEAEISTPRVIVAAGYRAKEISSWVGVDVPIAPYRRQIFATEVFPELPDTLPMVVDFHTGLYMRKESGGIVMGMVDKDEPSSTNTIVDWDYMLKMVECAVARVPVLEKAKVMRGWAGLYDITPDSHAILGKTEVNGFYLAAGFSGHGFMHAPAVGKVISEIVIKGKPETVDVAALNLERFKSGEVLTEGAVI
ncbi:MAG: FAD-binding oxidoreductase [Candidatus Eisenbacteria bacterium]|nr:FAD-binding oxidoreductase [Candidatus Eisenbacteria bacterium]